MHPNSVLVKTAKMYASWGFNIENLWTPAQYARDVHYPDYPTTYLRGRFNSDGDRKYLMVYYHFEVDGRELSTDAAKILFKDDYPGHIINDEGLFNRDYVFKQFHRERPYYENFLDVRSDVNFDDKGDRQNNFDPLTNYYEFTGGNLK